MKLRRLVVVTLAVCALVAPTRVPAAESFDASVTQYVNENERENPLFASRIGIYTYDDFLPDYSAAGRERHRAWLDAWRARFAASIQRDEGLGVEADRAAVIDAIDAEVYEDRMLTPIANNPGLYVGVLAQGIFGPLNRTDESVDVRMTHIAHRLALVPGLVASAEGNLQRPAHVAADLAIMQNRGAIALYENKILPAAAAASPAIRAQVEANLPAAIAALKSLQAFLEGPLLARADGPTRVGAAVFDTLLRLRGGTSTPRAELVARARADMKATQVQMARIARTLYHPAYLSSTAAIREVDDETVTRTVLDELAKQHPPATEVLATARTDVAHIEDFLRSSNVVALPIPETLIVRETPAFQAGVAGASMSSAGPFAPLNPGYYNVDAIPANWDPTRVESYLREYNNFEMQILSIHEAVPGHYVQLRYANEAPSLVRKVFGNGAFIEGWACYTEGMMLDAGYGENDQKLRLFQLKWRLREYANAIIDADYHTGGLTHDAMMSLLVDGAFQEPAEAEGKWHRLELSHDQLSTYFIGLDAIETARAHAHLPMAEFNRRLLRMGSVEPRFIEPLLGVTKS